MNRPIGVGVIGAGAVSDIYLQNMIRRFSGNLKVISICARHQEHADQKARQYGLRSCRYEEMLNDSQVELIVNLTPVGVHGELIRSALCAGKHVYTEKTLAVWPEEAKELIQLASEKQLYLGAAPDTFLGSSLQTARAAIDEGKIGEVTSITIASTRNNDYLTSLLPFFRLPGAGILRDYAVYYMTAVVSLLGPVAAVSAFTRAPYQKRTNIIPGHPEFGDEFETPNESILSGIFQLESGVTGTIGMDGETIRVDRADVAVCGTKGMLLLGCPNEFGDPVRLVPCDPLKKEYREIRLDPVNEYSDNCRGLGLADMAKAIGQGRECRASKELALHVLEAVCAMETSAARRQVTELQSRCTRPEPLKGSL